MKYACRGCGAATPNRNKLCSACGGSDAIGTHTGWSVHRHRAAQQRFRDALMVRAGGRCERVVKSARCTATEDLRACHIRALADGGTYDLDNGELLCEEHDRETDPQAR